MRNAVLSLERVAESVVIRFTRAKSGRSRVAGHVLVAGPGNGSVGDEAMYLAFARNVAGPVTVVARRRSDLLVLDTDIEYVFLPNLLYGSPIRRLPQLLVFLRLARSAASVSFIGADTMDGVYSNASSVRRFRTARQAAGVGTSARILGFSWNRSPTKHALREMRRTSPHVDYLLRDRASFERIVADGAVRAVNVADLAFLTVPNSGETDLEQWIAAERRSGRVVVLMNANPYLERWFPDQFRAYLDVLSNGLAAGVSFALIPHDTSGVTNDLTYEERLFLQTGPSPHLFRQPSLLAPAEIVRAAALADVAVTGRMHFAILCSVARTPALSLSYQDKVSGLYALIGIDYWINPGGSLVDDLGSRLTELIADTSARATLDRNVPHAIELARLNIPQLRST